MFAGFLKNDCFFPGDNDSWDSSRRECMGKRGIRCKNGRRLSLVVVGESVVAHGSGHAVMIGRPDVIMIQQISGAAIGNEADWSAVTPFE